MVKLARVICGLALIGIGPSTGFANDTAAARPRVWVESDPEATEAIYEQLRTNVVSSFDFPQGTPLGEVLDYLRTDQAIQIHVDKIALDELGIGLDESVEVSLVDVRLRDALRLLLEQLELDYIVRNGIIFVTSEEESSYWLSIAAYDVRDLLLDGDYDSLIETITSTIAADTWAENGGGEAEIRAYPQRGVLLISQATDVHEKIGSFLDALRLFPVEPDAKPPTPIKPAGRGGAGCGASEHEERDEPTPATEADDTRSLGGGGGGFGGGGAFGFGGGTFTIPSDQAQQSESVPATAE